MKAIGLGLINIYQATKPIRVGIMHSLLLNDRTCRFYPTCSDYTGQAIKKYGMLKGGVMGVARITRCNPLSKGGLDPVK